MAYNEDLANRVRRVLSNHKVVEKKMMGKLVFMVNGSMCCSVGEHGILARISPEEREAILGNPHVEPMRMGARVMTGFVRVSEQGIRSDAALSKWIEGGIKASAKGKPAAKKPPRGRTRRPSR